MQFCSQKYFILLAQFLRLHSFKKTIPAIRNMQQLIYIVLTM